MAERTSTRTTSRRTTPQPVSSTARVAASQSPQRRTTRTTRSQSRDISDSDGVRKSAIPQRAAKQTASDGTDSAVSKTYAKSRKGRPENSTRALQDLTTVPEDPPVVYPNIPLYDDDDFGQAADTGNNMSGANVQSSKSPGAVSAFSGTTARTSLPALVPTDLDSESMLDALPDLSDAANKLLRFLMPTEISEATIASTMAKLHTKGAKASVNWKRHSNAFQAQRELYGSDPYISPPIALKALLGKKQVLAADPGPWRPDALLHKSNLAALVSNLFARPWPEQEDQFIDELEQASPRSFVEVLVPSDELLPGQSSLVAETFRFALNVRTQYAIALLARHSTQPNFDSDIVLHQVFYIDEANLKGWGIAGLHSEDLTEEYQHVVLKRLEQLREVFLASFESSTAAVERLRTTFAWTSFVYQTVDWISQRLNEIEVQILSAGGNQAICQSLSKEIRRIRLSKVSVNNGENNGSDRLVFDYEPPSEASNTTSEKQIVAPRPHPLKMLKLGPFRADSPKAVSAAASLKRRISGRQASNLARHMSVDNVQEPASDIQVASTAEPSVRAVTPQRKAKGPVIPSSAPARIHEDSWQPQGTADDDESLSSPPEPDFETKIHEVLALRNRHDAESNKENIGERQTGLPPPTGQRRLIDPQPNAKRLNFDSQGSGSTPDASQDDINEEDSFQEQHLPANTALRRRLKASSKRVASEPPRSQDRSPKRVRIQEAYSARGRDVAQARQPDEPQRSQIESYKIANATAKELKALQVKPPQIRNPWTVEETARLLELIEEHGTSWKRLKMEDFARGDVLRSRDQVAVRDKARNMKMDYLASNRLLPPNFYRIPLSKIHIARLKSGHDVTYDPETGEREDAL